MKMLNLGCGAKTCSAPEVINLDWSIYLRFRKIKYFKIIAPFFLKEERLKRFNSLPNNIIVHNLSKGIPFPSNSIDVVYHSHFLEHLDKDIASSFLLDVKRVLKPEGIQRIVVPDFEKICRAYISHISNCENDVKTKFEHDLYVSAIIEQSVRKEASGTRKQKSVIKFLENIILGDARKRGETHQWMYDRINLSCLLISLGYRDPTIQNYDQSRIPDWNKYGLDLKEDGSEYKPGSLYLEVLK